jgi:hypothetical protein
MGKGVEQGEYLALPLQAWDQYIFCFQAGIILSTFLARLRSSSAGPDIFLAKEVRIKTWSTPRFAICRNWFLELGKEERTGISVLHPPVHLAIGSHREI